jgi:HSP20 family protein
MLARLMSDFAPLMRLQSDVNRLFEGFFDDMPAQRSYGTGYPALNAWEDDEAAYVEAELPGLSFQDIEVYVQGNELTLRGERRIHAPWAERQQSGGNGGAGGGNWHRQERARGRFARSLSLPWEIDADRVEAKLGDGVLTVRLPKAESSRPKKVKVLDA